ATPRVGIRRQGGSANDRNLRIAGLYQGSPRDSIANPTPRQKLRGLWTGQTGRLGEYDFIAFLQSDDGLFPVGRLASLFGTLAAVLTPHIERVHPHNLDFEEI